MATTTTAECWWIKLEFDQEGDVIRGQVLTREPDNLLGVLLMHRTEDSRYGERAWSVPNVINDSLELWCHDGKVHGLGTVAIGILQVERVVGTFSRVGLVGVVHKVFVSWTDGTGLKEVVDTAIGERVEIATEQETGLRVLVGEFLEFFNEQN